jgi:hypothetical protein
VERKGGRVTEGLQGSRSTPPPACVTPQCKHWQAAGESEPRRGSSSYAPLPAGGGAARNCLESQGLLAIKGKGQMETFEAARAPVPGLGSDSDRDCRMGAQTTRPEIPPAPGPSRLSSSRVTRPPGPPPLVGLGRRDRRGGARGAAKDARLGRRQQSPGGRAHSVADDGLGHSPGGIDRSRPWQPTGTDRV